MPWNKKDNPFDETQPPPKKKKHPKTMVTVRCQSPSCVRANRNQSVNLRMENEETGVERKFCRDCEWQWEMIVGENGAIKVTQSNQFGAQKREIAFQKVWQEKHG